MNKKQLAKMLVNTARNVTGRGLQVASFHPVFNIPYVGTGVGGAMFDLGDSIVRRENAKNTLKNMAKGFVIGETIGAVPYVGKLAGKTKVGGAIAKNVGNVANKVAELPVVRKVGQKLDDTAEYLQNQYIDKILNKQVAYHGSPYDFEKFSNKAIGTGEGAQAHGMGHYAAKNKDVASDYADRLTKAKEGESSTITYDNIPYEFKYGNDILANPEKPFLASVYANRGNYKDVVNQYLNQYNDALRQLDDPAYIEWLRAIGDKSDTEATRAGLQKARDFVNNFDINKLEQKTNKQLYKLSVPKKDVMLREDELLSTQPNIAKIWDEVRLDRVNKSTTSLPKFKMALAANDIDIQKAFNTRYFRDALEKARNNPEKYKDLFLNQEMTGKHLYGYLENILGSRKAANEYLQQRGVKGISYNGGIDGEATVIFNPDDIKIIKKYYNQPSLVNRLLNGINYGGLGGALAE